MHLTVIAICLLVFSGTVGFAVKKLLDQNEELKRRAAGDDILAKVADGAAADLPEFIAAILRDRRAKKIREQLPDALDMIANSLSAGLTLPQALLRNLDHFSPLIQAEFARVIYDTRLGFSVADAFENFSERLRLKDVKLVSIASRIGVEHGGNLAENYRMLSALLRDNLSFESELNAMTTEGRMQAIVMSCLPFALMLILLVINPEMMLPLVTTGVGWGVIAGLCAMLLAAYFWISKIVKIEV